MLPWTEAQRLAALAEYDLLDTPPEEVFDALTQAAARACGAPMAAVTLIDRERQWFKAGVGLDIDQTRREDAFCDHTIRGGGSAVMVVPDAAADPRFAANPFVLGGPKVRFYAGAPILGGEGLPLGALCVFDRTPRPDGLTPEQAFLLRTLADQVSEQLKLRRIAHGQRAQALAAATALGGSRARESRLGRALETGGVGWWEWDVAADRVLGEGGPGDLDLPGDTGGQTGGQTAAPGVPLATYLLRVDARDRAWVEDAIRHAVTTGDSFLEEFRLADAARGQGWVSVRGRCFYDPEGRPTSFSGVVIDITARKDAETRLREADMGRELALRAAHLGRWDHRPNTGERYLDPRAMELFALRPGQEQRFSLMLTHVHPQDREQLSAAVAAATDANRAGPYRQTFRVVEPETGAVRWIAAFGSSQFENGVCTRFLGVMADVTAEETAAEHRRVLTAELNHRVKNTMALVMSVVMSSLRGMAETQMLGALEERLVGLGRAHDLLTAENWSAAAVPAVVEGLVETLALPRGRLELSGPALRLGPKPALHLALALHELATNAIKYGALSNDTGRVRMSWEAVTRDGVKTFGFTWAERGGPPVSPPTRTGFGSRLIQRATAAEFGGTSVLEYRPEGVEWRLRAPFEGLAELGRAPLDPAG